jgi:asparagine synthase (glutamine-hydrolysing)
MCGICGFTGKQDEASLKRMTETIVHRGPDDDGFYTDGKVNLGMRRLSIIDVETGQQPIHNEDKNLWTVFNGEIYNFIEIREELLKKGHTFYTDHSDTELIVHLYEEYGEEFIHKINGMFAIALWDNTEERLLLIRDRMGVKPLFYTIVNGNLIFGSEIKAILVHPAYRRDINYEAIYHYFTFKHVPAPLTAFQGIYSLLPGQLLTFKSGQLQKRRYWKVRFREQNKDDEHKIQHDILTLLEDAVRLRMRCDVPFGAYLSGGVDSSSVVALMTRFAEKPVMTFALGYEDELKNKEADLYYARKVSKVYNTEHHEYIMSHKELIDDISDVIEAFDQPFSGTISTYFLTKLLSQHVKVALSGDGADELFGSYLSHRTAQPMYHFVRLYEKVSRNVLSDEERDLLKPCDLDFLNDLFKRSGGGDELQWRYQLYLFSDKEKTNLLSNNFRNKLNHTNTLSLVRDYFEAVTSQDPLNRILEMEWNTQLPDQVLAFVDYLSMAHSVEIRSPFLDYRLVEYVATIPGRLKIRNGIVKDILKRAVAPLLPEGITKRPNGRFDWMVEKLKDYNQEILSEKRLRRHNLLNVDEVKNIIQCYYSGDKKHVGRLWNLMMFQEWWEKYFG